MTHPGDRATDPDVRSMDFGGLEIRFDRRVLAPRPWTAAQSQLAARLIAAAPPGPVLELCAGVGHIGLLAVRLAPRPLVCVEADPVACTHLRANATRAGIEVEVREGLMAQVLAPGEEFAVVVADPPWVPAEQVSSHPEDPTFAIDGGVDGLDLVAECLRVISTHLAPGSSAVLQVGPTQAPDVDRMLRGGVLDLRRGEVQSFDRGALVVLHRT